jgi:hypothetical protein
MLIFHQQGRTTQDLGRDCRCPYIGASRLRDCSCLRPEDIYSSPLKELHFLRIIVDEGHVFSSKTSKAVTVATKLITAERRWAVSGTPAKDYLTGVDLEMAAHTGHAGYYLSREDEECPIPEAEMRFAAIDQQAGYDKEVEKQGAAKHIGVLLSNFLQVRPWAAVDGDIKVEWEDYCFRHEDARTKTYDGFSLCLKSTLEANIIKVCYKKKKGISFANSRKTRPEHVEEDVVLPDMYRKVVYLTPSFYDRLTINLFVLFLTSNAVTSERTDVDYLFHPKSVKPLRDLIRNLRQSNFFWTGWARKDVEDAIAHSVSYLEKESSGSSLQDKILLRQCLDSAQIALGSISWNRLSLTGELGIFVNCWPGGSAENWALNGHATPAMIGATQLGVPQRLVNSLLSSDNLVSQLKEKGDAELTASFSAGEKKQNSGSTTTMKMGVPSSGLRTDDSQL